MCGYRKGLGVICIELNFLVISVFLRMEAKIIGELRRSVRLNFVGNTDRFAPETRILLFSHGEQGRPEGS